MGKKHKQPYCRRPTEIKQLTYADILKKQSKISILRNENTGEAVKVKNI